MAVYYDWPSECIGVREWMESSWNFFPESRPDNWPTNKREWGYRIFGLVFSNRKIQS